MATTLVIPGADFSAHKIETVVFGTVPCTGISLDQQTKSLTALTPFTLTATPAPANTTDLVEWSSSDNTAATVNDGVVTPLKLGTVTITATCGNYSASCAVTINNVVPDYIAVCGYSPYRRTASGDAATTDKKTGATSGNYIVARNNAIESYQIESKNTDTTPYRFIPIMIPAGAVKVKVSTTIGVFYTRFLWFDSTQKEATYNTGVKCVAGTTSGWDQQTSIEGPFEKEIPTGVTGLDSFCSAFATGGDVTKGTTGDDYTTGILIEFLYA